MIEFDRVAYAYPGAPEPALDDVSLQIGAGEFCVIAGLSASGKSTLLRAACGLVPHFHGGAFAGRVSVGGLDTREHGPDAISVLAGTLFQDPETQIVMGNVASELAFPLENRGHQASAVARGVEEIALALGIEQLLERSTRELSGGELQRVALGAALAGRPRVLLLDEPTSQLDPVAGDELIGLLRRLNEEWGTTVVLVEHRLERCLAAADRAIALEHGRIACDGSPRELLEWAGRAAPALQTPAARLFARAGLRPLPAGVKDARATLRAHGLAAEEDPQAARVPPTEPDGAGEALRFAHVWHELRGGPAILRDVELRVSPGERIALMGRNGAGKSTLLRHAAGLLEPTRGRVTAAPEGVALLLQNPGDYFLRAHIEDEAPREALERFGLAALARRNPRDLSGGERQRLALAIVTGGRTPAVLCLDEPTRGMDRGAKGDLAELLRGLARRGEGAAVIVATHDVEFAAAFADRVVLLGDGRPVADGPAAEVLAGGWYFSTETARILDGAALLPEDGAELLERRMTFEVSP